jgi:hypothetical protein
MRPRCPAPPSCRSRTTSVRLPRVDHDADAFSRWQRESDGLPGRHGQVVLEVGGKPCSRPAAVVGDYRWPVCRHGRLVVAGRSTGQADGQLLGRQRSTCSEAPSCLSWPTCPTGNGRQRALTGKQRLLERPSPMPSSLTLLTPSALVGAQHHARRDFRHPGRYLK